MNDDKLKARIVIAGQKEAVFSVKASLELNSKIAVSMRDSLNNRMIELMVCNQEGVEELQRLYPEYVSADVDTQLFYERPFLETVAFVTSHFQYGAFHFWRRIFSRIAPGMNT